MSVRMVSAAVLCTALIASAVANVYVHHLRRSLFVELQELQANRDDLQIEWGQLQLEQGTWAAHERVERLALERLNLRVPQAQNIVLVIP